MRIPRSCAGLALAGLLIALLAGCATETSPPGRQRSPEAIQADIQSLIPERVSQRAAWAVDLQLVFAGLKLEPSTENVCAVIAVTAQESGFNTDPPVPNLARVAREEIDRRAERLGVPGFAVSLALTLRSPDGRAYEDRLAAVKTERELSELFEAFINSVPLGQRLFAGWNPVRTGGPMQVSVDFAEEHVRKQPYPYPRRDSVRDEVFSRRGGLYFGIAVLLDYPTSYGQMIYRFADFNAGRYSSRNAAFQEAVARLGGQSLVLDGDLLRYQGGAPAAAASDTQRAVLALAPRLRLSEAEIERDLRLEKTFAFEQSALYQRLYALADASSGERKPREILPRIELKSPKISRRLTTEWFARRVDGRYRGCLERYQVGRPT